MGKSGSGPVVDGEGLDVPDPKAEPGALSTASGGLFSLAGGITGQGSDLKGAIDNSSNSFSDIAKHPMLKAGTESYAAAEASAQAAVFAGKVTKEWSSDVTDYIDKTTSIVAQYATEKSTGGHDSGDVMSNAVIARDKALKAKYQAKIDKAHEHYLDMADDRRAQLNAGPTAKGLRQLAASGSDDGWLGPGLWPTVSGPKKTINELVEKGVIPNAMRFMTPEQARDYIEDHPGIAAELVKNKADSGSSDPAQALLAAALLGKGIGATRTTSGKHYNDLSRDEKKWLALLFPKQVGNNKYMPFESRAWANGVRVVDELENGDFARGKPGDDREDLYKSIIAKDRQIIYFDPDAKGIGGKVDGAIAELHGPITSKTHNVGLLVPGTGTNIDNFDNFTDRSRGFQHDDSAMITWLGGDMPDGLQNASGNNYAAQASERLAAFSHQVRAEMNLSGASDANLNVLGHSYGGATVGMAETKGLDADRVIHIESAGAGYGVQSPQDYDVPGRPRFAMTAPNDPIQLAQESETIRNVLGGARIGMGMADTTDPQDALPERGHGADPDDLDDVRKLGTGDLNPLKKHHAGAHSAMLDNKGTDSWRNIDSVLNGGGYWDGSVYSGPPGSPPDYDLSHDDAAPPIVKPDDSPPKEKVWLEPLFGRPGEYKIMRPVD